MMKKRNISRLHPVFLLTTAILFLFQTKHAENTYSFLPSFDGHFSFRLHYDPVFTDQFVRLPTHQNLSAFSEGGESGTHIYTIPNDGILSFLL